MLIIYLYFSIYIEKEKEKAGIFVFLSK